MRDMERSRRDGTVDVTATYPYRDVVERYLAEAFGVEMIFRIMVWTSRMYDTGRLGHQPIISKST